MKFEVGHIYTHRRMPDVYMLVTKEYDWGSFYRLDVRWFKRNGLDLQAKDTIDLRKDNLEGWYEYATEA